jgi:hypothetical protein
MKDVPCFEVIETLKRIANTFSSSVVVPDDDTEENRICGKVAQAFFAKEADHLLRAAVWLESNGWTVEEDHRLTPEP